MHRRSGQRNAIQAGIIVRVFARAASRKCSNTSGNPGKEEMTDGVVRISDLLSEKRNGADRKGLYGAIVTS